MIATTLLPPAALSREAPPRYLFSIFESRRGATSAAARLMSRPHLPNGLRMFLIIANKK